MIGRLLSWLAPPLTRFNFVAEVTRAASDWVDAHPRQPVVVGCPAVEGVSVTTAETELAALLGVPVYLDAALLTAQITVSTPSAPVTLLAAVDSLGYPVNAPVHHHPVRGHWFTTVEQRQSGDWVRDPRLPLRVGVNLRHASRILVIVELP